MIQTDACGPGSAQLGRMRHHVHALQAVLWDGSFLDTSQPPSQLESRHQALHQAMQTLADRHATFINHLPGQQLRGIGPYHLDPKDPLTQVLCASEGTLAIITACTLRIVPLPTHRSLHVLGYASLKDACQDPLLKTLSLPHSPCMAAEMIDQPILARMALPSHHPAYPFTDFLRAQTLPGAITLVMHHAPLSETTAHIQAHSRSSSILTAQDQSKDKGKAIDALWLIRKQAAETLARSHGLQGQGLPFIEDTVVPLNHLAPYVLALQKLLDQYGVYNGMYGHLDAGCLHVRPAYDLTQPEQAAALIQLSEAVCDLNKSYQGVLWGQHGRGRRSFYTERYFPQTYLDLLSDIKTLWDPYDLLNPGAITRPEATRSQALHHPYQDWKAAHHPQQPQSWWQSLDASIWRCNGNGACFSRKQQALMCPSYQATGKRIHSPKARALLLQSWQSELRAGRRPSQALLASTHESLQGCLGCLGCVSECPASVHIPHHKSLFLAYLFEKKPLPLPLWFRIRSWLLAYFEHYLPYLSRLRWLYEAGRQNALISYGITRYTHLVSLPAIPRRSRKKPTTAPHTQTHQGQVYLLSDALIHYLDPSIQDAYIDYLETQQYQVTLVGPIISGKSLENQGFLKAFKRQSQRNASLLQRLAHTDRIPILGMEPSLMPGDHDLTRASQETAVPKIYGFQAWWRLYGQKQSIPLKNPKHPQTYYLLSHCHERARHPQSFLDWQRCFKDHGLTLQPLEVGCCGMAGSYGYGREHLVHNRYLGTRLITALDRQGVQANQLLATGYACRQQYQRYTQHTILHPVQKLLEHLRDKPS